MRTLHDGHYLVFGRISVRTANQSSCDRDLPRLIQPKDWARDVAHILGFRVTAVKKKSVLCVRVANKPMNVDPREADAMLTENC